MLELLGRILNGRYRVETSLGRGVPLFRVVTNGRMLVLACHDGAMRLWGVP